MLAMRTEHFKKKLEAEKMTLESEMQNIGRKSLTVPNDWEEIPSDIAMEADLADQADIVVHRSNTAAVLADLEARYDTILAAIHKIENKTYGVCEVCGDKIGEPRLEANPSATTCAAHMQ